MTEPETSNPSTETDPDPAVTAGESIPVENATPEAAADPLAHAQAEADKWKDLAYRSQAELDNFRKRATREAQETRAYANGEILRSILPILDNFEMGLEAARAESEKSMIFMGMQMVHRQFLEFLKDFGVQEIESLGKPFDPNVHEAVSQEVTTEHADGSIIRVTRRGYRLKERMLRPASVIVATATAPDAPSEA
jgi:molecular chaperone GrpE